MSQAATEIRRLPLPRCFHVPGAKRFSRYNSCVIISTENGTLALSIAAVMMSVESFAQPPKATEVRVSVGTKDGKMIFSPSTLRFKRGQYYKLVIKNPSPDPHYFTSDAFSTRVFTRKVEVLDSKGKTTVELHGDIRDIELLPGTMVAWFFYPMTKGTNLKLYCHKKNHEEAGMVGKIEIFGPPPFTGQ